MVHTLSYIATLNATGFITGMRSMMTSLTSGKWSNIINWKNI